MLKLLFLKWLMSQRAVCLNRVVYNYCLTHPELFIQPHKGQKQGIIEKQILAHLHQQFLNIHFQIHAVSVELHRANITVSPQMCFLLPVQFIRVVFTFYRPPIVRSCDRSWRKFSAQTGLSVLTSSICLEASQTCWRLASACSWRWGII